MRLGEMAANEAAATVGVKCRTTNDRVGRKIKARSVIVTARESPLDATFRSVLKRSTVSAMIHDVETKVHKLQLIRKRHSAVQQIQVMESECLDFVPTKLIDVKLDKISSSAANPLNQSMRVELEGSTMFHGFVIDPVDQLFLFDDSGQRVVVGVSDVCRCFGQTKLQCFVHRDEDVFLLVFGLTSKLGDLQSDLD
jgi:hypothetical protein